MESGTAAPFVFDAVAVALAVDDNVENLGFDQIAGIAAVVVVAVAFVVAFVAAFAVAFVVAF